MTEKWIACLYIWPYSGMKRGENVGFLDQFERKERGQERVELRIDAEDFDDARHKVQDIIRGVRLDERVWQCKLYGMFTAASRDAHDIRIRALLHSEQAA